MPRPAMEYRTASRENYKEFCKDHPNVSVTFETFKKIIYTLNENYSRFVLEGEKVKLPQGFGSLAINKKKQVNKKIEVEGKVYRTLPINWQETRKTGQIIYHTNRHTDGYKFTWYWFKSEVFLPETSMWAFNATRINSRTLAKFLKQEDSPYIHIYKEYSANR